MASNELHVGREQRLTMEQRIAAWFELMSVAEQFLLAGLRRSVGPQGDLRTALRQWYAREMDDHDVMMRRLLGEFVEREGKNGL